MQPSPPRALRRRAMVSCGGAGNKGRLVAPDYSYLLRTRRVRDANYFRLIWTQTGTNAHWRWVEVSESPATDAAGR